MSERGAIGNFFRDEDGRGSHLFRINTFDIKTLLHTFQSTLNIRDKNDGFANGKPFAKSTSHHWWGCQSNTNGNL